MIFGRKNRAADSATTEPVGDEVTVENEEVVEDDIVDEDDAVEELSELTDFRDDGPFDISEVDLSGDGVERLSLGAMVITLFDGMELQFQGDPETQAVHSVLVRYGNSGLQLDLFSAPTSSGLADDIREDILDEAEHAGGSTEVADGPFGPEIKRVLPIEGPEGEQLFHVSRVWLVDGPRWLLRGTLMGQAATVEGEEAPADVFVETFRNVVVTRDDQPRVPGELIELKLPENENAKG